ncbi:hypothetical protein [Gracilibacillus kekensis]|uniref:YesK-like protein n=1 Tax=Gracilibacillus kekensis TaxID=1027249 RepID=A0A1M7MKM7_9BACI|nr:hypothetical protein [Gracilibacillus kekensis]SHM91529.1 YesK-like protein [Gracilibacillus kekensis]
MLVFVPVAIGVGIGSVMLILTKWLKNAHASFSKIPALIGLIACVVLIVVAIYVVRGFEGAAYIYLAVTILLFSMVSFAKSI